MSAFICVLERSGAAVDPRDLHRLAEPLASYGPAVSTFLQGPVGIAIRHRHGADARHHGPLADPQSGRAAAVAGRFRIVDALQGTRADREQRVGCAGLALADSLEQDGELLAGVSGSFVTIVADPAGGWIRVARDHLGDLKAYYFLDRHRLIAASEPAAILRHGAVSRDLDEGSAARFLGFRFGHTDRSFFRQIQELPPAHRLHVTASAARTEQYWRFSRQRLPEDIPGEFLRRLRRCVTGDLAGLDPAQVAVSLSGGLDSTALAALAPREVRAFSWYFDETLDGDERPHIEAVSRHLNRPIHWVRGDGLYPLCGDFTDRFVHENSPYVNAFAALKSRLYEAARAEGCERILVGDGGDALYAAREYWLRDALTAAKPRALASLAGTIRRARRGDEFARLALRRLLPRRASRGAMRRHPSPWLTAAARAVLPEEAPSPILPPGRNQRRHELVAGAKHIELESEERRLFAQCGVDRANPFWSWPLLEMAIHLRADWSYRDGRTKVLSREALRGLLPEQVLASERRGLLGTFFLRGIELRKADLREIVFRHPLSDWQRYVRPAWLEPYLSATRSIAFGHTILWRVISYELWQRRLLGKS